MTEEQYLKWADFIIKHFQENRNQDNNIEWGIEDKLAELGCEYRGWDYKNIIDGFIEQDLVEQTGNGLQLKTKGVLCKGFVPILIQNPETASTQDLCEAVITILNADKSKLFHINEILERMGKVPDNLTNQTLDRLVEEGFVHKKITDVFGVDFTHFSMSLNGNDIIAKHSMYSAYKSYLKGVENSKEEVERMKGDLVKEQHKSIAQEARIKDLTEEALWFNLAKRYWLLILLLILGGSGLDELIRWLMRL